MKISDQLLQSFPGLSSAQPTLVQDQLKVLTHRELTKDTGFLRQITDAQTGSLGHGEGCNRVSIEKDLSAIRAEQSDHQVETGCFACTIRAEKADHFTGFQSEGEVSYKKSSSQSERDANEAQTHGVNGVVSVGLAGIKSVDLT